MDGSLEENMAGGVRIADDDLIDGSAVTGPSNHIHLHLITISFL